jgi:hypothetical protein
VGFGLDSSFEGKYQLGDSGEKIGTTFLAKKWEIF